MKLHIIYLKNSVLLSKKSYSSWREIQDEYEDFKASLGPWAAEEVEDFLEQEYLDLEPSAKAQVAHFVVSDKQVIEVTFHSSLSSR